LREALRLSPGESHASYILAGVLEAEVGPNAKSVTLLEQAAANKPRWLDPAEDLAAELAALERFDEAAAAGQRGLALARANGDTASAAELVRRIAGYRRARGASARTKH